MINPFTRSLVSYSRNRVCQLLAQSNARPYRLLSQQRSLRLAEQHPAVIKRPPHYASVASCLVVARRQTSSSVLQQPKTQQVPLTTVTMAAPNRSEYIYTNDTPVYQLDATTAFRGLSHEDQRYAHYLSKASWFGSLAVLFQTSPESPLLFALFRRLFADQSVDQVKQLALGKDVGMTDEEWKSFIVYVAAFYNNMGNYRGFGDSKFIPNLPEAKFEALIKSSAAAKNDPNLINFLWDNVKERLYSLAEDQLALGFAPKGTTTYWSSNMTAEDAVIVKKFFEANNLDAYNTRAMKDADGTYVIRFASALGTEDPTARDYFNQITKLTDADGHHFRLERGDYAPILSLAIKQLERAANKKETRIDQVKFDMLQEYIKHFTSGNLAEHKAGSRWWIKDKGPIVESYIGFIENYRDPAGQRAEFEGFVAVVNKEMSKKFNSLVEGAVSLLTKLPWSTEFEKDRFLKPDFTSLDVLTFSGSGIPAGINIPNYDEIRQNEGFKNVSLGNVITASLKESKPNFLSAEDAKVLEKYVVSSFEVQVGLHELLGHGSGKLLKAGEDGKLNFDQTKTIDPLTGKPVAKWYAANESYDSKFGSLSSAYEECRAECVGLYLCLDADVLKIFGHTDPADQQSIIYANWLSMVHKGIESLKMYNPSVKKWLQAHSQARYVITRVLLESAKDLVAVKQIAMSEEDGKPDLLITLNKELIQTQGKKAIQDFLLKLQTFKSLGDAESAIKMFGHYSTVADDLEYPYLQFRDISLARKKPRRLFVQAATSLHSATNVDLRVFEANHEGVVQSFQEHFSAEDGEDGKLDLETMLVELWKKDVKYFS